MQNHQDLRMSRKSNYWIAKLIISEEVRWKLLNRHGITPEQLLEDFQFNADINIRNVLNANHRNRYLIFLPGKEVPRVILFVDLVDANFDIYQLRTAFYSWKKY